MPRQLYFGKAFQMPLVSAHPSYAPAYMTLWESFHWSYCEICRGQDSVWHFVLVFTKAYLITLSFVKWVFNQEERTIWMIDWWSIEKGKKMAPSMAYN